MTISSLDHKRLRATAHEIIPHSGRLEKSGSASLNRGLGLPRLRLKMWFFIIICSFADNTGMNRHSHGRMSRENRGCTNF